MPNTDWKDSASQLLKTINGMGYFYFSTLKEYLYVECCTARQAVLNNLDYIRIYPDVYGSYSAKTLYENGWS